MYNEGPFTWTEKNILANISAYFRVIFLKLHTWRLTRMRYVRFHFGLGR